MAVRTEPEVIHFGPSDRERLVTRMRELASSRDGWVNLLPVPDDDTDADDPSGAGVSAGAGTSSVPGVLPARAGVFNWLLGRDPAMPACTWVPGETRRKGTDPDSLGIQHGAGSRVVALLRQNAVDLPAGWRVLADHPRRGLVLELPTGTDPTEVLDWLLRASDVLSGTPLPDRWVALVHRR